jgi:hypothetical protein
MYKGKIKSLLGDFSDFVKSDSQLSDEYKNHKVSFIVRPLIVKGGVNIMGAERSSGKTRLAVHLAYAHIFESREFIGYELQSSGSVLYLNLEIKEAFFNTILNASENYFTKHNMIKRHPFYTINLIDSLDFKFSHIKGIVEDLKPSLIIIDGFKMLSSLYCNEANINEMKNQHLAEFYKIIRSWIAEPENGTILLTNHTNKGTRNEASHSDIQFGPGALLDYADHVFLIRKTLEANSRVLIPTKVRFADESEAGCNLFRIASNDDNSIVWPELLQMDVDESEYRHKSKSTYTQEHKNRARELFELGKSMSEIAKEIGGENMSKGTIAKWKQNGWI